MSARGLLSMVGTAVGGLIGWSEAPPPADPECLRGLLSDLGREPGDSEEELTEAVRAFQSRAGLTPDGVAGPRTVHVLARKAQEARDLRLDLADLAALTRNALRDSGAPADRAHQKRDLGLGLVA